MAYTSRQIIDFLLKNPDMTDDQIVKAMETYGVSPAQMAEAVGLKEGEVAARAAATVPQGQTVTLGDTVVQPVYQVTGSGMDQQVGGLENVITYKAVDNQAGGAYTQYTPTGVVEQTGTQQEVRSGLKEFVLGAGLLFGLPTLLNAGAATGAAATAGTTGSLTAGLTVADIAALEAGLPTTTGLLSSGSLTAGGTVAGMGTGTGITTAGAGGLGGATNVAGLGTGVGTGLTTTGAGLGVTGTGAGITAGTGLTGTGVLTGSGLGTTLLGTGAGALTGTGVLTGSGLGTTLLGTGAGTGVTGALTTGVGTGLGTGLGTGALTTGVGTGVGTALTGAGTGVGTGLTGAGTGAATGLGGLTAAQLGALISGGLNTGAGLLQQQTSREAAIKAQGMIDTETAAAKASAAFKPIGMTTRFGSSQFVTDPVTGRLTSAGYTLTPEAKNAQDRFVKLAESGLQQAEGAQLAFKPLQTGAESLFKLGAGYLAKSPEDVAQNYLNQQMALLKPGRELELAALQNKLQQQGRGGLSVAQGGTYGATTPELQALYNARAKQEAELAAYAQQAGQKDVLFGAGLLGQGSTAMGNYYAGQQSAYAPYTTALQQVTGLESAAQQPLTMSTALAQQVAQAGSNVGQLGLRGAEQSVALATGKAATTNPYATLLSGLGSSAPLGTAAGNALYSLFG